MLLLVCSKRLWAMICDAFGCALATGAVWPPAWEASNLAGDRVKRAGRGGHAHRRHCQGKPVRAIFAPRPVEGREHFSQQNQRRHGAAKAPRSSIEFWSDSAEPDHRRRRRYSKSAGDYRAICVPTGTFNSPRRAEKYDKINDIDYAYKGRHQK